MTYSDAMALFVNDVPWSVIVEVVDETGAAQTIETDMSEYAISGPITDNRDGTVTIRMGKYRESELMRISLSEAPKCHKEAQTWRNIIEDAVQSIEDDNVALEAVPLYPMWNVLVSNNAEAPVGFRFQHEGNLYKVAGQHTFAAEWVPGVGTESLYARIDESHAGTIDDPIPYNGNMELISGTYYTQNGVTYLCDRDTGAPVYNALSDLVGIYVQVVS